MGVWEWITSGADTLKRRTAEATPVVGAACRKSYSYGSAAGTSVKDACLRGYGYGRAATATVDGAVRAKLEELPDGQSRHRFLMNLAKNGTVLIAKSCVGAVPVDMVMKSLNESKKADLPKQQLEALAAEVGILKAELNHSKNLLEQALNSNQATYSLSKTEPRFNANVTQEPEDAIRVFMMSEFCGSRLLDDLIVPGAARSGTKGK